jgi:hypothetical protein
LSRRHGLAGLLGLALVLWGQSGLAQTLRVTTWSLQAPAAGTNAPATNTTGIRIPAAAAALKKLNPDVVLLQQVTDWAMCEELIEALKPAKYSVVTCSAFRDARGTVRKQQTAILAKGNAKPYFSWSDTWRNRGIAPVPGGFAFAALQIGQQRVGLFSVQAAAPAAAPAGKQKTPSAKQATPATPQERLTLTIEQLLAQVGSVSTWATNRVQGIIVGGTFSPAAGQDLALHDAPLQLLRDAGFVDAFQDAPVAQRTTVRGKPGPVADYIFTQPANCTTNPTVLRTQFSRRFPVTCDVQLGLLAAAIPPIRVPVSLPVATNNAKAVEEAPPRRLATSAAPPAALTTLPAPPKASNALAEAPAPRVIASATPAATPAAQPATPVPGPQAGMAALPQPAKLRPALLWVASAGVGLSALTAIALLIARRRKPRPPQAPALLTAGSDAPSSYTVIMGTRSAAESSLSSPRPAPAPTRVIRIESQGMTQTQAEALRQRALAAEQQAERANALIRNGLIPDLRNWLKQKLARKLISDRAGMIETQQAATRQAAAVEQRLARVEQQVQQQNRAYVQRIEDLTRELLVAKEENRELIRTRIAQVKAEMAAARDRLLAQEQAEPGGRG